MDRPLSDRGESLVEVLVTVIVLGIAGVAILAGLELTVKSSDLGRKQATGGSYARSLAEAIQDYVNSGSGKYKPCAPLNYYTGLSGSTSPLAQAALPPGYSAAETTAQTWSGPTSKWVTCSVDNGAQLITLTVTSTGSGTAHVSTEQLTVVIRNPCTGTAGSAACA